MTNQKKEETENSENFVKKSENWFSTLEDAVHEMIASIENGVNTEYENTVEYYPFEDKNRKFHVSKKMWKNGGTPANEYFSFRKQLDDIQMNEKEYAREITSINSYMDFLAGSLCYECDAELDEGICKNEECKHHNETIITADDIDIFEHINKNEYEDEASNNYVETKEDIRDTLKNDDEFKESYKKELLEKMEDEEE